MEIKNKERKTTIDYKAICELSHRMDHTVTESDFNTEHPNSCRINYIASDIHRYLKYVRTYSAKEEG